MGERIRGFVPFGEFAPDLRRLRNDGLLVAKNVVPVYGSYISSPTINRISDAIGAGGLEVARGLHVDSLTGNGYFGLGADLWEITDGGVVTNRTRTAAGNYAGVDDGWLGTSFGSFPVMCPFDSGVAPEPVQYLAGGAARFSNMISSTFAPRAKYVFPLRHNLFLAHCYLTAPYDTLASGYNRTLVAWSRNDDITQFGSQNTNPEITGSDYQPLNYDLGEITGGIAGADYGIVSFPNGTVRIDGPPYTFRVTARTGTIYPYSMVASDRDIYFWGPGGLTRLPGGEGPGEIIGLGRFARSLIDYSTTGFSTIAVATSGIVSNFQMSCAYDPVNNLLFISYQATEGGGHSVIGVYNITEDRLSIYLLRTTLAGVESGHNALFMRSGRSAGGDWQPGRDIRFVEATAGSATGSKFYAKFATAPNASVGSNAASPVLQKGYLQLNSERQTRIIRIRPIYSVSDQGAIEQITVALESTNKPYLTPITSGPYSALDSHGWIVTPDSVFSDLVSPVFTITANPLLHTIAEYEGFEYEAELGGLYAA